MECLICVYFVTVKNRILYLPLLVVLTLVQNACTIEKRHHMRGYHIEWFGKRNNDPLARKSSPDSTNKMSIAKNVSDKPERDEITTDTDAGLNHDKISPAIPAEYHPKAGRLNERMARQIKLKWFPVPWMAKKAGPVKKTLQDYNKAGVAFGMVALIFAILCFISIAMALVITAGWSALGWFVVSLVFGLITLLFTIIAQTIFWKNGEGIPAMMILPLIISLFAIYVLVRLILDRILRT